MVHNFLFYTTNTFENINHIINNFVPIHSFYLFFY